MTWYKPYSWFREMSQDQDIVLRCDNPQCKKPIRKAIIAYDPVQREIYHYSNCPLYAIAHRISQLKEEPVASEIRPITRKKALSLYKSGELRQTALTLEGKIAENMARKDF